MYFPNLNRRNLQFHFVHFYKYFYKWVV